MLTSEQRRQFETDGYILVPEVLTASQIRWLRDFFRPKFDLPPGQRFAGDAYGNDKYKNNRLYDIYNRYPEARWLLFHKPVLDILRSLLGDDCVEIPECSVALNSFGVNQWGGWHKDTTTQEIAGYDLHYQDDFLMVGLAYYLQDNTEEYGGGLDVQPGSHRQRRDPYRATLEPLPFSWRLWRKARRMMGLRVDVAWLAGEPRPSVRVASRAGDLLIFHSRLNHRATMPRRQPVPRGHEKIAVFDTFSRNRPYVRTYLDFLHSPAGWEYMRYLSRRDDFVKDAKAAGVGLAMEGHQGADKAAVLPSTVGSEHR